MIRHRACLLKDFAHEMVERELDPQFEKTCEEIKLARKLRGANKKKFAPQYLDVEEEEVSAKEKERVQYELSMRSKGIYRCSTKNTIPRRVDAVDGFYYIETHPAAVNP